MVGMRLTPRQKDVLARVCLGETSKVIAQDVGISEQAVKGHIAHLFEKFGVTNRASLAASAIADGNVRRQAISDRYHERARALARENETLRQANAALRSHQGANRRRSVRGHTGRSRGASASRGGSRGER